MADGESGDGSEKLKKLEYFLPTEVVLHNKPEDCWVSYLGGVYDLTELCYVWKYCREINPILANAGKDISHWFDHEKGDIRYYVNPLTGVRVPYCPHGPIPDVGPSVPTTMWRPLDKCPWWLDDRYKQGYLTQNPRPCRIINSLTGHSAVISVCEEDTIRRIQERFLTFNAHGGSYKWKFEGKSIDMNKTLTDNGILDERDRFVACGLSEDIYVPSLVCYFNDDMTEA
ncbi:cytochrome b5 domain-containing protein 1 [Venturia canescens]|uniref:cytochrome b5 domain-containing protein 1 n=1 Tax=Venturia canescens TaxID=32260 RepID=UPI001C9C7662|nr:cytochrome b5 domain-containing protein 1 [Venturia canescens]